ncbi:hypothetical protein IPA_03815 [Ignicoccus pacificus DSM 13166]|uniref:UPF0113 domain-containing protein n=1 Tax=Ignicoccus pacificus DSM 13166 TaxID=940294 RepID=A0A977KCQ2_9CREN|nr:hypothetical protein IPA_03815 [Ignicoccus pacificus DSM 13166]
MRKPSPPSFFALKECLGSKLYDVKFRREGNKLFASHVEGGSYLIEEGAKVTPGGVKLLASTAGRGIIKVMDEKKAMLFLYGRDLFSKSFEVIKKPCKRGYVLVYWEDVLLGLALLKTNMAINLVDFGIFLRRGY